MSSIEIKTESWINAYLLGEISIKKKISEYYLMLVHLIPIYVFEIIDLRNIIGRLADNVNKKLNLMIT